MLHIVALMVLALLGLSQAQECSNYGIASGSTCQCPPQFGGLLCDELTCGNPLLSPAERPTLNAGSTSCSGQCQSGFSGVGCNVCTSAQACSSAPGSGQSTLTPDTSSGIASTLDNTTIVCNQSPYVYTQGFVDCNVDNVAISGIFPGSTTLSIQKTIQPNISLAWPFGEAGSLLAQLFYSANTSTPPEEQFYCQASSCSQAYSSDQSLVDYTCSTLECNCITGRTFCGGTTFDLSSVINTLAGPLEISCATNTTDCSFRQSVLQGLFGPEGLGLTGCSSGECVRQGVIDRLDPTIQAADGNSLSGGVIAGLAVIGGILLALLALFILGKIRQRKARRAIGAGLGSTRQVGLAWQDVSYSLPSTSATSLLRRRKPVAREDSSLEKANGSAMGNGRILHSISGRAPCGQMLAIIGASGAGKSTLVDILAGKRKVGSVNGTVSLLETSGDDQGSQRATIGYVDQEDVLPPNSTVREALMFAAQLKMSESIRDDAKRQRVEEVLDQLGLTRIADSRIGSTEKRGISGGERRRLSIGLELMAQPSILICDEPTSGLDSVSALRVIEVLRNLAQGSSESESENASLTQPRTTIIATIHQPSSRIYHSFDLVCVLAEGGRQVYFGPAKAAEPTFAERGFPLPAGFNMADHLLEIASMSEEKRPAPICLAEQDHLSKTSSRPMKHQNSSQDDLATLNCESSPPFPPASRVNSRHAPVTGMLTQLEVLSAREMHGLIRDKSLLLAHNGVAILLGIFIGGLYYQTDTSIAGFQNRIGALFFIGSLIAFSALSALSNFAALRPLFLRERAGSYYSPSAWLASRILFDIIPLRIIPTIIVATIAYWMVGLSGTAASFFKYLLIAVEYSIAATLLNLLLATLIKSAGVAVLFSAILCLFQMAFAGFFVNLERVPAVLRWLQWLCPLKYALEALSVNEVNTGLPIQDTLSGVTIEVSASLIMQLLFGFKTDAYYRDVLVLFAWIALWGLLLIVSVKFLMREIR